MNLPKTLVIFLVSSIFLAAVSCTPRGGEKSKELQGILDKIASTEKEISDVKERIKSVGGDQGLQQQLSEEEQLLQSRLERLKVHREALGGEPASAPPRSGGHH